MARKINVVFFILLLVLLINSINITTTYSAENNKPYDIVATFNKNPLTEKNINWITSGTSSKKSTLKVWQHDKEVLIFTGTSEKLSGYLEYYSDKAKINATKNKTAFITHKATATGLSKNTKYFYQCGDGDENNWSEIGTFWTGNDEGDFSFIYMTDPQAYSKKDFSLWQITAEQAVSKYPNASFVA